MATLNLNTLDLSKAVRDAVTDAVQEQFADEITARVQAACAHVQHEELMALVRPATERALNEGRFAVASGENYGFWDGITIPTLVEGLVKRSMSERVYLYSKESTDFERRYAPAHNQHDGPSRIYVYIETLVFGMVQQQVAPLIEQHVAKALNDLQALDVLIQKAVADEMSRQFAQRQRAAPLGGREEISK